MCFYETLNKKMFIFIVLFTTFIITGFINCIFLEKKNLLIFLVAAEFLFLGIILMFIGFSLIVDLPDLIIASFILFMMTVGESAVGLGMSILCLKLKNDTSFYKFKNLKF
jgi:NADH:ubiquinone oxidoreductase subunit K